MYKAIVIDRNQIVMDVLAREMRTNPNNKNIAIFYGAGHMQDFEQRFNALGYTKSSTRWMTAWSIGQGPLPERSRKAAPNRPMKKAAPGEKAGPDKDKKVHKRKPKPAKSF
jgi:hypothetical protein